MRSPVARWFLNKVEVTGGFLGSLSLALPQGLICIIGPRGSGKSTLAEALRYTFCGTKGPSDDRYPLIRANLGSAVVTASAQRISDGAPLTVRRLFGQPATIIGPDGRPISNVELDRGTFLPFDAYSAEGIDRIAVETFGDLRRTLLDELQVEELHAIQTSLSEHRRSLEGNADAIRSAERTIADSSERIEELGDARGRLAALPATADDESSANLLVVAKQQQFNESETRQLAASIANTQKFRRAAGDLIAGYAKSLYQPVTVPDSANATVVQQLEADLGIAAKKVESILSELDRLAESVENRTRKVAEEILVRHASQAAEYASQQEQHQVAGAAVRERTAAQQAVALLESFEKQRSEARALLDTLLEQRKEMKATDLLERERVSSVREAVAARLEREAGAKVRVRIARNADSFEYQQTLRAGLKGAGVKNHDDILSVLMRLRPEQIAQLIQQNDVSECDALTSLGTERCRKILDAYRQNLDPLSLEIVAIDDKVSIELNVGSGSAPNFKDAAELSSGQKCTALLPLLMARRDNPLIIDQPEDNLDNHFIYETVVETIRRLKSTRQMLFITHNANIPVLAEADLVVVLDSDGKTGGVAKVGTLDECRDEIIDLLEGGREAFELRRKRYAAK
jgi:energy-coupling factor transporter ATP-binding protein EcfA2